MSYYNPSFSQTTGMSRGRGGYSPRSSYRGSSRGSYSGDRYSYSNSYDSRSKYGSSDRFSSGGRDYRSSYRPESRDSGHRSPDRKRMRTDGPSSHRDSYGYSGRYDSSYSEKRSYSGERHSSSSFPSRKEEFRRPSGPPPSARGSYRGRLSSRGPRGGRGLRDRAPMRRRLVDTSYAVRKRPMGRVEYGRRPKISRVRSVMTRRPRRRSISPKDDSSDEKDKKDKKKEDKDDEDKDDDMKEGDDEKKSIKKEKEGSDKDSDDEDDDGKGKKNYIKLVCPHCNLKAPTFRTYLRHLSSKSHMIAMRKVAMKQKSILSQMRQAQRNTQNELEKSSDDLSSHTNFCPLCKLNYKQRKAVHQSSESHKNMRKFLLPFCKVCNVSFKSPMSYESHCCSIAHIKRKQRVDNSDASGEEDNLEDFTTIDSVGDGDGASDGEPAKKEEKKEPVNVGIEQIKRVEAHYCDLCKMYLPRAEEADLPKVLAKHCKLRVHMHRYVLLKERQELEKKAEKLQRKENAAKEKRQEPDDGGAEAKADKAEEDGKEADGNKSMEEDKLWADVDKDLGDILAEAESGAKSSDEDEDDSHVGGERYDRFKLSQEKNGEKGEEAGEQSEEKEDKKKEEEKK